MINKLIFGEETKPVKYAVYSTVGFCRAVNEDNYYLNGRIKKKTSANSMCRSKTNKKHSLYAVCDGLGGEEAGEEAAYLAVSALKKYHLRFHDNYLDYLNEVNRQINTSKETIKGRRACTFAGLSVTEESIKAVNVGDSRIYLFRDGSLTMTSKDHSEYQTLLDFGLLSAEEYYSSNKRNLLTRCLGQEIENVEPHVWETTDVRKGDIYLLCSDGFCGYVRESQIIQILSDNSKLLDKCEYMVQKALEQKSDDNITVMLIEL